MSIHEPEIIRIIPPLPHDAKERKGNRVSKRCKACKVPLNRYNRTEYCTRHGWQAVAIRAGDLPGGGR